MSNLARTYCVMGRPQDALRLDINAYEHMKRALAADDPQLGGHGIFLRFIMLSRKSVSSFYAQSWGVVR